MKRGRGLGAACSGQQRLPASIRLKLIADGRIRMASRWKRRWPRAVWMWSAWGRQARSRRTWLPTLNCTSSRGPILERLAKPLGVVLGTKGVERWAITFHGQEAHSGSTPMEVRHDALAAAAKLALEIRPIARKHPQAVATMGSVKTFPGIVTAVVGRCEATLDMRDLDAGVLAGMLAEARAASERFAKEEGCTVEWSKIWSIEPIPFHPEMIALCEQAIVETVDSAERLPSGPLHDAAEVARLGIPTVMMFVQSLNGLSHNRAEDTKAEHLEQAVVAFAALADRAAKWIAG
jgi:N-carbamoyl-L-amino-acid hydrolase